LDKVLVAADLVNAARSGRTGNEAASPDAAADKVGAPSSG
jgi:hypothetical protein